MTKFRPLIVCALLAITLVQAYGNTVKTSAGPLSKEIASLNSAIRELESTVDEAEKHLAQSRHHLTRRDVDEDACHLLENKNLPASHDTIAAAWNNSTSFLIRISDAVDDIKQCPSWNAFKAIPCAIKAVLEFRDSYVNYKPQIVSLISEIKDATAATKTNFIECAKILIKHRS